MMETDRSLVFLSPCFMLVLLLLIHLLFHLLLLLPGVLCLLEHDEEYVFTLPSAYARSILTVPWVELGGKVSISCVKSGYSATVTFHTKPFYGGKVHRWVLRLVGEGGRCGASTPPMVGLRTCSLSSICNTDENRNTSTSWKSTFWRSDFQRVSSSPVATRWRCCFRC